MTDARTRLVDEAIELSYFMRGGIGYDSMFDTTYHERQRISEFIEKRLEAESKKHPSIPRVY